MLYNACDYVGTDDYRDMATNPFCYMKWTGSTNVGKE